MDTGKKAKLEIQTNLLHYRAPQHYVFTDKILMHQTIKHNTLTKAKQFSMPTLNEHSHLDTHASHMEPCCNVGNKTHLPFVATYNCQPTHIPASSPSTRVPLPSAAAGLPQHCFTYQQKIQKLVT